MRRTGGGRQKIGNYNEIDAAIILVVQVIRPVPQAKFTINRYCIVIDRGIQLDLQQAHMVVITTTVFGRVCGQSRYRGLHGTRKDDGGGSSSRTAPTKW